MEGLVDGLKQGLFVRVGGVVIKGFNVYNRMEVVEVLAGGETSLEQLKK